MEVALERQARDLGAARAEGLLPALVRAALMPLVRRFQVGEGMLLLINASVVVALRPPLPLAVAEILCSALALAAMYSVNDLLDARRDLDNPRKDHRLAATLLARRSPVMALFAAEHALAVIGAWALVGPRCAIAVAAVLAENAVYSLLFKGVPVVDVVVVGLWGGTFAAMVAPAGAAIVVGAMTALSHVYQALGDRDADLRAGVKTSARSRVLAFSMLAASSVVLTVAARERVGTLVALAGMLPLVIGFAVRKSLTAWLLSKLSFAFVWLMVLDGLARSR